MSRVIHVKYLSSTVFTIKKKKIYPSERYSAAEEDDVNVYILRFPVHE